MAKRRRNLGGFSWKRTTDITRMKSKISRFTGIPLAKSGRQRKYGALTGGYLMDVLLPIPKLRTNTSAQAALTFMRILALLKSESFINAVTNLGVGIA